MGGRSVVLLGDSLVRLREMQDSCIDALVTDPPAGIAFMGKDWDSDKGGRNEWIAWLTEVMRECYRVMKPGAHGLVWALPRTSHWTATALENAGFEVRDVVTHLFGSGFPKSLDVSKAIDKAAGAERERLGASENVRPNSERGNGLAHGTYGKVWDSTAPATDAAKQWSGWGTALKPAAEFWFLVRKPLSEKTVAANVLKWGTGALNIDASRIGTDGRPARGNRINGSGSMFGANSGMAVGETTTGRFPSHLVLDEEAAAMLDAQTGELGKSSGGGMKRSGVGNSTYSTAQGHPKVKTVGHGDTGGASRFFYVAKAAKSEKNAGLEGMPKKSWKEQGFRDNATTHLSPRAGAGRTSSNENHHPTVKSVTLMRYLCRLITPPNGIILDPFTGSGSTGVAAIAEGFEFLGIESNEEYIAIAQKRLAHAELTLA